MSISKKIFAITFFIASLAILGIMAGILNLTAEAFLQVSRERLQESVGREAKMLQGRIDMLKADALILADKGLAGNVLNLLAVARKPDSKLDIGAVGQNLLREFDAIIERRLHYLEIVLLVHEDNGYYAWYARRTDEGVISGAVLGFSNSGAENVLTEAAKLWPGNTYFSEVFSNQGETGPWVAGAQFLRVGAPVHDPHAGPPAAVIITLDFDDFLSGIGTTGRDIQFAVADHAGRYLYRSGNAPTTNPGNMIGDHRLDGIWQNWLANSSPYTISEDHERQTMVGLHRVLLSAPLTTPSESLLVVSGVAERAALEPNVMAFREQLLAMTLGGAVLLGLALAWATTHLTRPIQTLTEAAERIAVGDRSVTIIPQSNDELGRLGVTLARMLEALRNSAKIEEEATLGRMASMVAHDLRNALSAIKMNLKILDTHNRVSDNPLVDNTTIALDQVAYMENILSDMLIYARPDDMRADWVDFDEVIRTAQISMLPLVQAKGVVIEIPNVHRLPKIFGDRTKLIQLLQNLLTNAIDALDRGGHVTLGVRALLFQSRPGVEITVTDDGPGIAPEILGKVFDPFFTTRAKGTGLGLTIVQRIVRQHGGSVHLAPGASGGTVAIVYLPLSPIGEFAAA